MPTPYFEGNWVCSHTTNINSSIRTIFEFTQTNGINIENNELISTGKLKVSVLMTWSSKSSIIVFDIKTSSKLESDLLHPISLEIKDYSLLTNDLMFFSLLTIDALKKKVMDDFGVQQVVVIDSKTYKTIPQDKGEEFLCKRRHDEVDSNA